MFEQTQLAERFRSLLVAQQQAMRGYADLAAHFRDPTVREQMEELSREKQKHIRLTERLLEILE